MRLARTVHGWYGLLNAVGMDFIASVGLTQQNKSLTGMIMSGLYMSHLTLLYCYMATPIVWAVNPQQFVFHEMVLGSAFLAAMTGIVLSVNPIELGTAYNFKKSSSGLAVLRFLGAILLAAMLIGLLFVLVQLCTEAFVTFGQ